MYLKQIEQLVLLQKIDGEMITLQTELKNAPQELAELEEQHAAVQTQMTQMTEKLDTLQNQLKRIEGEIDDDSLKVKKSKNKLMMVGNTKEYHAMMREMDSLEKLNRSREEEKSAVTDELARQKEAQTSLSQRAATITEELEAKRANLDARIAEAKKRLETLTDQRTAAGKLVPAPILGRYEFIRSRLHNPVIVPVDKGICGGCHISIPPQAFIELQKGQQILSCPNCQRLIYWSEHFHPQTEEEAGAKEASQNAA